MPSTIVRAPLLSLTSVERGDRLKERELRHRWGSGDHYRDGNPAPGRKLMSSPVKRAERLAGSVRGHLKIVYVNAWVANDAHRQKLHVTFVYILGRTTV